MPTLRQYRRQMYLLEPGAVGRTEAIASLPAGGLTMTVSALATGSVVAGKFIDKWLLRSDAAAAERIRLCSNFAAATGTLTHAGAIYADLTATNENVEIIEYEPYILDAAINRALWRARRRHRVIIPTIQGVDRYFLGDLTWIDEPSDIDAVKLSTSPVLTRNRHFEDWNTISAAGIFLPDHFTLTGAAATMARESTIVQSGQYSLAVIRAGTDGVLAQTIPGPGSGLLWNGVSLDSLRSRDVTVVLVARSANANSVRARIDDGVAASNTSYHTGNSTWQELSVRLTLAVTATQCIISARVEVNETAYIDELYAVYGTLDDVMRREKYPEEDIDYHFEQGGSTLALVLNKAYARGQQIIVESWRRYQEPTATLAADGDSNDAPINLIAHGGLAELYYALAADTGFEKSPHWGKYLRHEQRFQSLMGSHMTTEQADWGLPFLGRTLGPTVRRI